MLSDAYTIFKKYFKAKNVYLLDHFECEIHPPQITIIIIIIKKLQLHRSKVHGFFFIIHPIVKSA